MFVYFSFSPANVFHQTSVSRYVLAGGYKRCVHTVLHFSLPAFTAVRPSCSHAGCILWVLSANTSEFASPPPLLYCWMHSSTFLSLQVKAKPCQAAGVQLPAWSFLIHQLAPIKTTRIISWHRYAITGNLITNFDGAESLEQWSSTKSVDNCVRKTILITMKCYKNQLLTSYYICSSGGEIHVPSVVSSVAFQWQIRKEVFTASSKHLVATIWALYSPS